MKKNNKLNFIIRDFSGQNANINCYNRLVNIFLEAPVILLSTYKSRFSNNRSLSSKSFQNTVCPLYLWIQPTTDQKYSKKQKNSESSKKQNSHCEPSNYLHSIYIVLGIISNLEMI